MTLLVLDEKGYELAVSDGLLRCHHLAKGQKVIPWASISQLIIGKGVSLTSDVMLILAEKGIQLLFSGQKLNQQASLVPLSAPASDIKLRQYAVFSNPDIKNKLACHLVEIRVTRQRRALKKLHLPCPDDWLSFTQRIKNAESLMIIEAQLTNLYWQQWRHLFADLGFVGRARRPPVDPVNAILSLAATMEDSLYCKALLAQGLDVGLGVHHVTGYRRQSLIYDVKEITRADVEYWVAMLFLRRILCVDHFVTLEKQCRLNHQGQQVFYKQWHSFKYEHQKRVNRIARLVRKRIEKEARNEQATLVN
ncbi:hypothetical protein ABT56_22075 [Photobacterium aquae]|uniref:CRISPR-associated endonuclease Cas1 n=2 Tax=Photobacterium aquae TaxID=1195763 RepID=A0A0J1GP98_9GAMM|nr:hypothetical protein ABT56_22075 [Photobacterium aquae]